MVRGFGQPMEDNPIAELCGYGSVSGEGVLCETCFNIYPQSDVPYGCPVCNAPNAAMDAARARAEARANAGEEEQNAGEEEPNAEQQLDDPALDALFNDALQEARDDEQERDEQQWDRLQQELQPLEEEDPTGGLAPGDAGEDAGDVDDGALVEENLNKISNPPF